MKTKVLQGMETLVTVAVLTLLAVGIFRVWTDPAFADYMGQIYKAGGLYTDKMTVLFKVFLTGISLAFTAGFADDCILRLRAWTVRALA